MLTISTALAFFFLLIISSVVFFVSRKIKIPYTVLLVLVGLLIVPLVQLPLIGPAFGFLTDLALTPELLFYIFLPLLIFESAFNMNMRKMVESAWSITALAVVGLIISTILISGAIYLILPLVGLPIPYILALLFGAIISSTDPVAVLALFKEYGAPKRLTLIFEGESLFNDGTAVALFLVILGIAVEGFHGVGTVIEGMGVFAMMVGLGIVFGIAMAAVFSRGLRYTRSNEFVSIILLIVSAHLVFISSELLNSHPFFGLQLHLSPIIATTVSSLFLGNFARHILSPRSDEYLNKSIEHLAFVANSLVFLMAGILFASTRIDIGLLLAPILVTIVVVATARILAVGAVVFPLNATNLEARIPKSWAALLSWGSLRGALAIIVVLLIPADFTLAGWRYAFSPRDLLLAMTIGCILATLFLKAPTIGPIIRRLKINQPTPFQEAYHANLALYYLRTELARIESQRQRDFISDGHYQELKTEVTAQVQRVNASEKRLRSIYGAKLFEQVLRYIAIDVEMRYLKYMYTNTEVSEKVYRKIKGKLNLQKEYIEHDKFEDMNPSLYTDRKDVFDRLVYFVQNISIFSTTSTTIEESYQYYRAQSILSRKVSKTLEQMQGEFSEPTFDGRAFDRVMAVYAEFLTGSEAKRHDLLVGHAEELELTLADLARKSLRYSGDKALAFFSHRGIAPDVITEEIYARYQQG